MSPLITPDNRYAVGSTICAYEHPDRKLTITKYYQRIYYCTASPEYDSKRLVYFERELVPPVSIPSPVIF